MLSSHSRLTITPETHFFYRLDELRRRFGEVVEEGAVDELVGEQCRRGGAFADLGLDPAVVAEAFRHTERRPQDLFLTCLAQYGRARGKPRCGEKTPRHIERVEQIARLFPSAWFIAVFRDPRAVVGSELRARFGNPSAFVIAQRWVRYIEAHRRLVRVMPRSTYRMIRYEDLVARPEPVLRELCELLGEDFEPAMLAFHQRPRAERGFDAREERSGRRRPSSRWIAAGSKPGVQCSAASRSPWSSGSPADGCWRSVTTLSPGPGRFRRGRWWALSPLTCSPRCGRR